MTFIFDTYSFDPETRTATFSYRFSDGRAFQEKVTFGAVARKYNTEVLNRVLRLAFLVIGTSYLKTFPTNEVEVPFTIDSWTASFLNKVYQEGLSQFAFENNLTRQQLPQFTASAHDGEGSSSIGEGAGSIQNAVAYEGDGILTLQSGGKDSLLTAQLLQSAEYDFTPWYLSSSEHHPKILDTFKNPVVGAVRSIDHEALSKAKADGGRNGHVPVTYIVQSIALIQAVLLNKNQVLTSIGHEGEEPHATIGDLSVTHQWSKTWSAEQLYADYVARYISPDITIGSPLRGLTELRIAELFVAHCWPTYGHEFSSCNMANYQQGADNTKLQWCGNCPKCANSYILFAPFVEPNELQSLFGGQDLFAKPSLQETFKGLLGVEGVMKPFECVGEIDELRHAYTMAQQAAWPEGTGAYQAVSFAVPEANFDSLTEYPAQDRLQLL